MDFHCVVVYLFPQFCFWKNGKNFEPNHKLLFPKKSFVKDARFVTIPVPLDLVIFPTSTTTVGQEPSLS